jgi:ketosteroid isomerase-like protein
MSDPALAAVRAMVDRETDAWNRRDTATLVSLFHSDMVWVWPPDADAHDPLSWVMPMGRFNAERWAAVWQDLFDTHELVHNERTIRKLEITPEGDGAFAVVDIDTFWRRHTDGLENRWQGRVCKIYARCADGWKMTAHTGVLAYG